MREYITMFLAFIAIIVFVVAIISGLLMRSGSDAGEDILSDEQIKEGSITGAKISDGTITDQDISTDGISKIADNSINMKHLSAAVLDALMELTNLTVVNFDEVDANSIDASYLTDSTITDEKIDASGISKIASDAITSDEIMDGSITIDDLSSSIADMLSGISSGSSFQGNVIVNKIEYAEPRTHYYSIGSEHFQPVIPIEYSNGGGYGGAYLVSGEGKLVAPVNLPDGATIDSFKVHFYDRSVEDMDVYFKAQYLDSSGYFDIAHVESNKNSGYYSLSGTLETTEVVDNQNYAYHILAQSDNWSSQLKIKGVVIGYTISEVE